MIDEHRSVDLDWSNDADVDVRPGHVFPFAINMEKAVAFDPRTELRIA